MKIKMIYELPANFSICGATTCGKSYLAENILKTLIKKVHHIFIMSPTINLSGDFSSLLRNEKVECFDTDFSNLIKECFIQQEENIKTLGRKKTPQIVIVIDDCINHTILRYKGLVDKYSTKSRHYNISFMVLSQRITGIPRTYRLNSKYILLFSPSNFSEMERFVSEYCASYHKKHVIQKLKEIFNEPYNYLLVKAFSNKIDDRLFINGVDKFNCAK